MKRSRFQTNDRVIFDTDFGPVFGFVVEVPDPSGNGYIAVRVLTGPPEWQSAIGRIELFLDKQLEHEPIVDQLARLA